MNTEIELKAYYNNLVKTLEQNLKFTQEALAKYTEKYDAAEKKLKELGFKEVMIKHGLDWFYNWEADFENPRYKPEQINSRD